MRLNPADNFRFLRAAIVGEASTVSIKHMQVSCITPRYYITMILPPMKPKSSKAKEIIEIPKQK